MSCRALGKRMLLALEQWGSTGLASPSGAWCCLWGGMQGGAEVGWRGPHAQEERGGRVREADRCQVS